MKLKNLIILSITIAGLFMFSSKAFSVSSASILYQETDLGSGRWKYDYTFSSTPGSEYLYGVRLNFSSSYNISNPMLPNNWDGFWGNISPTTYLLTYSDSVSSDIAPGSSLGGFSFTINSQVGSIPYTAYFDDHQGVRTPLTGTTAAYVAPVVPEPISSVLFLAGGTLLIIRNRWKRQRQPV